MTQNNVTSMQNEIAEELIGSTLQSDILRNLVNDVFEEERRKADRLKNAKPDYDLENVYLLLYRAKADSIKLQTDASLVEVLL